MTAETAQIYGLETVGDVRPRNQWVLQAIRHHLAESLQVMADCSEDDDSDLMLRTRHATPPIPRFEADISPRFQASEGNCVLVKTERIMVHQYA